MISDMGSRREKRAIESRRQDLMVEYRRYAENLAKRFIRDMGLPMSLRDEIVSAAYLGLVEAASRFDFRTGIDFKNYAFLRIRGSVIDALRKTNTLSGKVYSYIKVMEEVSFTPDQKEEKDVRLEKIFEFAAKGAIAFRLDYAQNEEEATENADADASPEVILEKKHLRQKLLNLVETLPPKERLIVESYYFNDKPFVEIARENEGLSKSTVSKIHSRALDILYKRFVNGSGAGTLHGESC